MMPCASTHSDLTSDGIQKMISSWWLAWVSCGGHFKHNHHLPWHWPLVQSVQEKQSHDLLLSLRSLCFDDGREMSNPMTSSEQKETLGLRYGLFQRSVVTHHFLFSGWTCQNQRRSKASKGKIFSQVTIYHRFYFGSNLIPSSPPIKPHP